MYFILYIIIIAYNMFCSMYKYNALNNTNRICYYDNTNYLYCYNSFKDNQNPDHNLIYISSFNYEGNDNSINYYIK